MRKRLDLPMINLREPAEISKKGEEEKIEKGSHG